MGKGLRSSLVNLAALAIAAFLFAASFPNLVFANGLPLLAWIAFVPVFWVARRAAFAASIFLGAFYSRCGTVVYTRQTAAKSYRELMLVIISLRVYGATYYQKSATEYYN